MRRLTLYCNNQENEYVQDTNEPTEEGSGEDALHAGRTAKQADSRKGGRQPCHHEQMEQGGQREMLRAAVTTTREEQIRNLYMQIAEMNKAIAERGDKYATSTEADTINKLSAAIAKMEGDYGIADIISVSKQILFWLRKRDPQKAIELSYYFDEFVKEKLR